MGASSGARGAEAYAPVAAMSMSASAVNGRKRKPAPAGFRRRT